VAHTRDWEPLADALERVKVMATGVSEEQAKLDLCHAMADRKINVRVRVAATGEIFSDSQVGVPPHLSPDDLDWTRSRPKAPWRIGPRLGEHYMSITGWKNQELNQIELSIADVIEVLCGGEDNRWLAKRELPSSPARFEPQENDRKQAVKKNNKGKGGRPRVLDEATVAADVRQLMNDHGEFSPDDSTWNAKARLFEALRDKYGEHISDSTLRSYVNPPLAEWYGKRAKTQRKPKRKALAKTSKT
jgi:hypothetical protein